MLMLGNSETSIRCWCIHL